MAKTREIKGRIKAVGNIGRITKTMQMIATARFQSMQKKATDAQAYTRKIREMVADLSQALSDQQQSSNMTHPLLSSPDPIIGKRKLLVITSDRGLCGAYNANVLRQAVAQIRALESEELSIEVVGKKGASFFKFNEIGVEKHHTHFGDNPRFEDVHALAQQYMDDFAQGEFDKVEVCYMRFESMSKQTPEIMQLLPLSAQATDDDTSAEASPATSSDYDYSPEPEELLAQLLPITVKQALYQAFNEAIVSEQIARMVAMKSATDAAGKQQKLLKRRFNRARQTAITTEISEIVSGAAALE